MHGLYSLCRVFFASSDRGKKLSTISCPKLNETVLEQIYFFFFSLGREYFHLFLWIDTRC